MQERRWPIRTQINKFVQEQRVIKEREQKILPQKANVHLSVYSLPAMTKYPPDGTRHHSFFNALLFCPFIAISSAPSINRIML